MRWLPAVLAVTVRVEQDGAARQQVEQPCDQVAIGGTTAAAVFAPGEEVKLKRFGCWASRKVQDRCAGPRLYTMDECLAAGANGFVWRARAADGAVVVLKFALRPVWKGATEEEVDQGVKRSQELLDIANGPASAPGRAQATGSRAFLRGLATGVVAAGGLRLGCEVWPLARGVSLGRVAARWRAQVAEQLAQVRVPEQRAAPEGRSAAMQQEHARKQEARKALGELRERKQLAPVAQAVGREADAIAKQLVEALYFLAQRGFGHQDLYEYNCMWDGEALTIVDYDFLEPKKVMRAAGPSWPDVKGVRSVLAKLEAEAGSPVLERARGHKAARALPRLLAFLEGAVTAEGLAAQLAALAQGAEGLEGPPVPPVARPS